jgi:hypothetical protein
MNPRPFKPFDLNEAIINHVDSGDLILDILEAQQEFANDKHALGVRVANILNDFADKVKAEHEGRTDLLASVYMQERIDRFNALGDFQLKQRKEA